MSAAMDHARSMMAGFRKGWESTGRPITREALRDHALFLAGIQRDILAEHPEWVGGSAETQGRAEMEAYEQIAREYAEPDDDGTEAEALAPVEVPRFAVLHAGASVVLNETVKPASLAGMRGTVPNPEDIENDHLMVDLGGWLWPCRRSEFDVVTPCSSQAGLAAIRYRVVA